MGKFNTSKPPGPPDGQPWVWLTEGLYCSLAWRSQSINCRRLVDCLLVEQMSHAGQENGRLVVPYSRLQKWGIGHRLIAGAIREAELKGLIKVEHGALRGRAMKAENLYTLTFLPARRSGAANGLFEWSLPSDDWKRYRLPSHETE
jgi:hypothetical protein